MSVLIKVGDDLARWLQAEAAVKNTSIEELANTILENARPNEREWGTRNQRRLTLIRKSSRDELTEVEQSELDELQAWLDERFESFDRGLLDQLGEMKAVVPSLSNGQSDG